MQGEKPEYIFIIDDMIGGVAYFNKNIINNTHLRQGVVVKLILLDQEDSPHPAFPEKILADEIIRFRYSSHENKYAVLKRLHKLFGTAPGAVICNQELEMEAIYVYGAGNKTIFQVIHDFYNIRLAVKYGAITDAYVTHTQLFRDILLSSGPATVQSFRIHHGVAIPALQPVAQNSGPLKLVFTGRLVETKGVKELLPIDAALKSLGIAVQWTIIGRGPLKEFLAVQWGGEQNVRFASPDTNEEVMALMATHDIFILPTHFEGSPVTVLEALSTGLVPIVSDLPGGITEIITEDIGRRAPIGNTRLFAEAIAFLHHNRGILQQMKENGRRLAEEKFDIRKTSDDYFSLFGRYAGLKAEHAGLPPISVGFRLDKKWLPNSLVRFIRRKTSI